MTHSPIILVGKDMSVSVFNYVKDNFGDAKSKNILGGKGAVPSYIVNNIGN